MDIDEIIEMFNDGDLDIPSYFNDTETFLKIMDKRGRLDDLDFETNYMENDYLLYLSETNTEKFREEVAKQISDVRFEEGKEPVLVLRDASELKTLFCVSRNDITQNTIGELLSGDSDWDRYWDTTDDIYRDVVEELNPENIERLKQYMLSVLTNWKIEVDDETPDLFNNYSEDDIFYLTPENVGDVIGDRESFMYLIDNNYLDDLESELSNIHSNAYNSAYETEIYNDVTSELETFFDMKSAKWEASPSFKGSQKLTEFYYVKFNPNEVVNSIKKYVADKNNWGYYDYNLNNVSTWINMMNTFMENGDEPYLDFRIPDYPDSRLVDKYINEFLPDYI